MTFTAVFRLEVIQMGKNSS